MPWTQRILASALTAAVLMLAGVAQAEGPELGLPVDCIPGETCWLVNLMDLEPGPGTRDYACGDKTYDGHDGTDFALCSGAEMARGVAVLAAAPGRVLRVRDGEADHDGTAGALRGVAGRECGNGVVIAHDGGWETQYCHMRRGGIAVQPGQQVERGARIGFVGMSGKTEFPHLHIALRKGRQVVDPFLGASDAPAGQCGPGTDPSWSEAALAELEYRTGMLFHHGFSTGRPDPDAMRAGRYDADRFPADAPALVIWFEIFAPRLGDTVAFTIADPSGRVVFEQRKRIERDQARLFIFGGRRRPAGGWPQGDYVGRVEMIPGTAHTPPQAVEATATLR